MAPHTDLDAVAKALAARMLRHRRALIVCAVLAVAYLLVYRRVDGFEVPPVIAASDPPRRMDGRSGGCRPARARPVALFG